MTERLVAYDGVLAARLHQLIEEEKKRNPSAKTLAANPKAEMVEGTAETLRGDPGLAGIVEVVEV